MSNIQVSVRILKKLFDKKKKSPVKLMKRIGTCMRCWERSCLKNIIVHHPAENETYCDCHIGVVSSTCPSVCCDDNLQDSNPIVVNLFLNKPDLLSVSLSVNLFLCFSFPYLIIQTTCVFLFFYFIYFFWRGGGGSAGGGGGGLIN